MNDPIERLRAADPVPEAVSHPYDRPVRATLQEILMTDATTPHASDAEVPGPPWFRNPRILAAAAAMLLVAGIVGTAMLADGSSPEAPVDAALPTAPDTVDPPDAAPAPHPDGEPHIEPTACADMYSLDALKRREYAFDGTVVAVEGPDMTFDVHEWFRGDAGDTVTLDHQGFAGMRFAPDGPALEPGTRVLAAGDGGVVWSCGFTQLHEPDLADQWRSALGG